jgi:hypothetical protein
VEEIESFSSRGFVKVGRVLDHERLAQVLEALAGAVERERSEGHEQDLLDPSIWPEDSAAPLLEPGKSVGFLFNLWLWQPVFRDLAFAPLLAGWAAQLIGSRQVRLLEDNALYKPPLTGGALRWHQDYSYWPIAQPNAVTAWVALDDVTIDNGAVQFAAGSHLLGERLPAIFGTGTPYLADGRPAAVREMSDPAEEGLAVEVMELAAGEASLHHSMTWHASGANSTPRPRRAFVVRYVGDGTIWLGSRRFQYNYSDDEVGIPPGEPIGGRYFPIVPY